MPERPRHLRPVEERDALPALLVDPSTGETYEVAARVEALEDALRGAERDLNGWRQRHANLQRDKEADARQTDLWPAAIAVFDYWRERTGHARSEWSMDRFEMIRPHLERSGTGKGRATKLTPDLLARNVELCKLAVDGLVFDPFVTTGRNGRKVTHDGIHLAFKDTDVFEKRCKLAPVERIREVFPPKPAPVERHEPPPDLTIV